MIMKLREQSHKRFIVPSESQQTKEIKVQISLYPNFPFCQNPNRVHHPQGRLLILFPQLQPWWRWIKVQKWEATLWGGSFKEKSTLSRINHPKSSLKATNPYREMPFQTLATSSCLISASETPTILKKIWWTFSKTLLLKLMLRRGLL